MYSTAFREGANRKRLQKTYNDQKNALIITNNEKKNLNHITRKQPD